MRYALGLLLVGLGSLGWETPGLAHGVHIQHRVISGIEIQARYDSGEPMQAAQVSIYAPGNPSDPWLKGTTDAEGRFRFTPDANQPGNWEVKVRQAGHGDIVSIPVAAMDGPMAGEPATVPSASLMKQPGELSPVKHWVTIAAVVWGFIGTALFFSRGKR